MSESHFYLDKTTHTFADALTAFGLATLLENAMYMANARGKVRMEDRGDYYELTCVPQFNQQWLAGFANNPIILAPAIRTMKNKEKLPKDLTPAGLKDYEEVRDQRNLYWEGRKALSAEGKQALARGERNHPELVSLPSEPDPDWDIYRALNPAGLIGYNALMAQWWEARSRLPELLALILAMASSSPNDVGKAEDAWKKLAKAGNLSGSLQATAGQLYNPAQGKGQNKSKADKLSMGNVSNFWVLEFLKAVGFYRAGFTRLLKGSKDRKTYVIAPQEINMTSHQEIMKRFKSRMQFGETATRSDVLTALRYTLAFLDYCKEEETHNLLDQLLGGGSPRDAVRGFYVAFYKNLGNSAATLNLSFINIPSWIKLFDTEDVVLFREVLKEHETVVNPLDESHSDAFELLASYRDFIASDDLNPFFQFCIGYSSYLVSQKERGKYAPQFTIENLRRLFMSAEPKLSTILDPEKHPGFQSIAYAIRQSTVVAQYNRKQKNDRRYDVRYGLGQELARKSRYAGEFVTALSEFLQRYNAENAQVMENRAGPYRKSVKTSDIDDIVALVDEFGSELICNLLIAYGYARSFKEKDDDSQVHENAVSMPDANTGDGDEEDDE